MDILLEDCLKPDDWKNAGLTPNRVAKDVTHEFKDRSPDLSDC